MGKGVVWVVAVVGVWLLTACGAQGLQVKDAWARSTPPGAEQAAVYLTIVNATEEEDALVGVSTEMAAEAALHRSVTSDSGTMGMVQVQQVVVPASGTVVLAPGGLHVMLMGLKAPLQAGQDFTLTLHFVRAGEVTVRVEVRP